MSSSDKSVIHTVFVLHIFLLRVEVIGVRIPRQYLVLFCRGGRWLIKRRGRYLVLYCRGGVFVWRIVLSHCSLENLCVW
jgi:hypothetical protein